MATSDRLRILHVFRAPVGGLFRHVMDLTREQIERGHDVGLVMDSTTGGRRAEEALAEIAPRLALGFSRVPMQRLPAFSDISAQRHVNARLRATSADVVHGHGSKGGLYARLPGLFSAKGPLRCYTPHGGSFHYRPGSLAHRAFMMTERALHRGTDLFLFESAYIRGQFVHHVGAPRCAEAIVLNGISADEFAPVPPAPDAADFLYIGELRSAKGIDTLLAALAKLHGAPRLAIVGSGPDEGDLKRLAAHLGLADRVTFPGAMPARDAFRRGRIMVVPSRAESLPYVLIEAAGAHVPLIATNVGGVGEIFGPQADRLIAPDDADLLARRMGEMRDADPSARARQAAELGAHVASQFRVDHMANSALAAYRRALGARNGDGIQSGRANASSRH